MPEENISGVMITFFSTASAVGKTLISVNMASELARQGYKVCLVDYDLQFGDVCNYLKLPVERSLKDVVDFMKHSPEASLKEQLTQSGTAPLPMMWCPRRSFWRRHTTLTWRIAGSWWSVCA